MLKTRSMGEQVFDFIFLAQWSILEIMGSICKDSHPLKAFLDPVEEEYHSLQMFRKANRDEECFDSKRLFGFKINKTINLWIK